MSEPKPKVIVIAGPNGAGKSTAARRLLTGPMGVADFVNADVIAQGLSAYAPEKYAMAAGRIMLTQLKELAAARESFAFETTLASRSFAPWIKQLVGTGYSFYLFYYWVPSPEFSIYRVALRVEAGGITYRPRTYEDGTIAASEIFSIFIGPSQPDGDAMIRRCRVVRK